MFQHQHYNVHKQIENIYYDNKKYWIELTKLFLDESDSVTPVENTPFAAFLKIKAGIY
jgi:hypothetical protein